MDRSFDRGGFKATQQEANLLSASRDKKDDRMDYTDMYSGVQGPLTQRKRAY